MTMTKLILSVFLSVILILSLLTQDAKASTIDKAVYPPDEPGHPHPPHSHANQWGRGCNPKTPCRGLPLKEVKEEEDKQE